jgi:AcrR family transcriptional regulator
LYLAATEQNENSTSGAGAESVRHTLPKVEWVRPPQQTRSQETLERILEAAEEVVAEKGLDNSTVSEIVRRAKSSVGAMYARFSDKDALLSCLHGRFCEQAMATADTALDATRWEDATIAEIFAEAIPFLVQVYHEKRGLIRAFIVRGGTDHEFAKASGRLHRHVSERLSELLLARRDEINHPDPALAVDFGLRMLFDTLDQATLYDGVVRSTVQMSPDQLGAELIRAYLSYLGIESTSS